MTIGDDSVVSFHYKLRDDTGTFNESSEEGSPVVYMHGHNNIVPGLEKELAGKKSGDKLTATVAPEEGYGQRNEDAVQRVPAKHLATRGPFTVGQTVVVNTREGGRQARVIKVGHFNVDLDLNHPLAGKSLDMFDTWLVDRRGACGDRARARARPRARGARPRPLAARAARHRQTRGPAGLPRPAHDSATAPALLYLGHPCPRQRTI
jgi:FKBP-type peptidyl-prolyl cis-trans isomerase SlyD